MILKSINKQVHLVQADTETQDLKTLIPPTVTTHKHTLTLGCGLLVCPRLLAVLRYWWYL